jgi:RNA recognition motif-containing protein
MSKDLFVKNISAEATEEDVRKLFSVIGKVSYIHLVTDVKTGAFKGCGYVKMASEAEAKDAIVSLDGARLINRVISVTQARPQTPGGGGGNRGRSGQPGRPGGRRK